MPLAICSPVYHSTDPERIKHICRIQSRSLHMEFQRCDRKKTLLIGLYPARRHLVPVWLTHADKWACDGPLAQNMSNTLKSDLVTVTSQRHCVRRDDSIVENVTWPPGCPAALLQCHARRQPHSHAVTSFAVATLHPSQSIISRSGHDAN